VATVSAVATTLFLGGYRAPWPFNVLWGGVLDQGWFTLFWFLLKVQCLIFVVVWARAALPRFRYDHFMSLGWKVLIPANLVWLLLVALYRKALAGVLPLPVVIGATAGLVVIVVLVVWLGERRHPPEVAGAGKAAAFDAYAGGYPVPPMPGTPLPELAGLMDVALAFDGQTTGPARRVADDEEVA